MRAEVESLLAHEDEATFIEAAIGKEAELLSATASANYVGRRIGAYRVTSLIGHGGMGTVYLAVCDDDQYQKQVALKIVKRGMDTDLVLNRFWHERQILAKLEHPHIARLLDGGTTEDMPSISEVWPLQCGGLETGRAVSRLFVNRLKYCA